jgi:hypothetical protein
MNREIREAFLDLRLEKVSRHQDWHSVFIGADVHQRNKATLISESYRYFGGVLDGIRLGIEESGYNCSHQYELGIILRFLKKRLRIQNCLGNYKASLPHLAIHNTSKNVR